MLLMPVVFPPGCARLAISPTPMGSATPTITMGIVVVACRAAMTDGVVQATMTSALRWTSSEARARSGRKDSCGQRTSRIRFRPST